MTILLGWTREKKQDQHLPDIWVVDSFWRTLNNERAHSEAWTTGKIDFVRLNCHWWRRKSQHRTHQPTYFVRLLNLSITEEWKWKNWLINWFAWSRVLLKKTCRLSARKLPSIEIFYWTAVNLKSWILWSVQCTGQARNFRGQNGTISYSSNLDTTLAFKFYTRQNFPVLDTWWQMSQEKRITENTLGEKSKNICR